MDKEKPSIITHANPSKNSKGLLHLPALRVVGKSPAPSANESPQCYH
ncbi:MAG: hypothetical protein K8953_05645 [Proteobacteria bacterium]|nr:hypothetical protein [Pseudomonadota bacterium]